MGFKVQRKPTPHPTCGRMDHDGFDLVCGYPLPCPHHTIIITEDQLFGTNKLRIN